LSFVTTQRIFAHHGLTIFDVQELPTHGGSLRIFARHEENSSLGITPAVAALRRREVDNGFETLEGYAGFGDQVRRTAEALMGFLADARGAGKKVVGYGAPGKGNTLLNYCGIRRESLQFTVDANPYKQGTYTPGTRIPIRAPEAIRQTQPDYVLILPWNLREEISRENAYVRDWCGRFVVPIPELEVF
jgi:hypothetical protein